MTIPTIEALNAIVARRHRTGELLTSLLAGAPGVLLPVVAKGDTHSYWFYMLRFELARFTVSRADIAAALGGPGRAAVAPRAVRRGRPRRRVRGTAPGRMPQAAR